MSENLANEYSNESTQGELSNEYQHDRVWMVYKNFVSVCFGRKQPQHWKGYKGCDPLCSCYKMQVLPVEVLLTPV